MPSQFIQEVTKSDLVTPSDDLQPFTTKVQAIRCRLTWEAREALGRPSQKNIVFVDTPSFLTGRDYGAEREMNTWLRRSRQGALGLLE